MEVTLSYVMVTSSREKPVAVSGKKNTFTLTAGFRLDNEGLGFV